MMTMLNGGGRWRWRVKSGLAAVISAVASKSAASLRVKGGYKPLVLGYHRVVEDYEQASRSEMASMLIDVAMFERHLDCLGRHFEFVGLDDVGEAARVGAPFAHPVVAVTFDDGYRDVFEHAMPLLKRKGIPAAMFVVTDLIGRSAWQIHDKLFHLIEKGFSMWDDPRRHLQGVLTDLGLPTTEIFGDRESTRTPMLAVSSLLPRLSRTNVTRVMGHLESHVGNGFVNVPQTVSWADLKQMRHDGFIVGSHTRSHVSLPTESAAVTDDELRGSKRALEQGLGEPIDHFAYPGGQFTPAVVDALAACGYKYAYTACQHHDHRHPELTIERLLLWQGSSINADGRFSAAILECQAKDLWPPARACSRAHAL